MSKLRIAITGLKGAGKTVFLTSLINNLIRGTADSFESFRKHGVIFHAEPVPLPPARRRFRYNEYLRQFRQEFASWPDSTVDVSEFRLSVELKKRRARRLDVHLVDYPGERLLDLPLLEKNCEEWSESALDESEQPVRDSLSAAWRQALREIPKGAEDGHEAVRRAVAEYKRYLLACRQKGLQFLQPSAFVFSSEDAEFLNLEFCPLPPEVREACPVLAQVFAARYGAYREHYVRPFVAEITRCARQVVLVDVLRVLRTGLHCFRDTQKCLEEVLKVYSYCRSYPAYSPLAWWKLLTTSLSDNRAIDQVLFVATKADLATRTNRSRLKRLLEVLVRFAANRLRFQVDETRIGCGYCAAFRCTEDAAKRLDGMPISVLKGRRMEDGAPREGVWFPGEVPEEWPSASYEPEEAGFMFPEFLPRPLPRDRDDLPIEHLNLDELFYSMIGNLI